MKVTIWAKKDGLISARIRVGDSKKFDISTKISLPKGVYIKKSKAHGKSEKVRIINAKLRKFTGNLHEKYEIALTQRMGSTTEEFRTFLKSKRYQKVVPADFSFTCVLKGYLELLEHGDITNLESGLPLSAATVRTESNNLKRLMLCAQEIEGLDFSSYNDLTQVDAGLVAVEVKYRELHNRIIGWLHHKNFGAKTINTTIEQAKKTIKLYTKRHGIHTSSLLRETFKTKGVKYKVRTMSFEQTKYIIQHYDEIRDGLSTRQSKVALEYWLTALLLVPRRADMLNWTYRNIYQKDGVMRIRYNTKKNDTEIDCQVPSLLVPIFRKNLSAYQRPLKYQYENNLKIKRIAKKLNCFQGDYVVQTERGGRRETDVMKEWQMLKLHGMRASGITQMIRAGIPEPIIKSMSGHSKNSSSYGDYQNITAEDSAPWINGYEAVLKGEATHKMFNNLGM